MEEIKSASEANDPHTRRCKICATLSDSLIRPYCYRNSGNKLALWCFWIKSYGDRKALKSRQLITESVGGVSAPYFRLSGPLNGTRESFLGLKWAPAVRKRPRASSLFARQQWPAIVAPINRKFALNLHARLNCWPCC